jgi:acyl-coenzyme A synthetase/AMP-(fatty) acid ligase
MSAHTAAVTLSGSGDDGRGERAEPMSAGGGGAARLHCMHAGSCGFAMPGMECVVMDPDTKTVCPPAKDPKNPTEPEQGELCYRGEWPAMAMAR